jgi:PAS domain S-box-containing protein
LKLIISASMRQLPAGMRVASRWLSPIFLTLLILFLQGLLVGAYFYLVSTGRINAEPDEIVLLLSYCALTLVLAIIIAIMRHRFTQRENRVRQRLLDVIDAVPDPSAVRDAKGRYVLWNKAAEHYHGIKAQHVLGKTPYELFPPAVARSILELDAQCAEANQTVVKRLELPPLYGKGHRIATIRVAPVHTVDDRSNVRGAVTILHDITDAEHETSQLRHTASQLKAALDASGFGTWEWILEDQTAHFGEGYQRLLRYRGTQFAKDFNIRERLHPDDVKRVKDAAVASIASQGSFDLSYRLRCFDDVYRSFRSCGEVSKHADGKTHFAGLLCPLD